MPETSSRPCFGAWICRGYPSYVARFLTVSCFRLSLRRARAGNHCPKLQRSLTSVHEYVAAVRHTLPGFSPRLAFGCPPGAAGQKIIARYFIAALLRCIDLSRLPPERSPDFHRGLLSVVPPARPDRKSLPETSTCLAFGCPSGAAGQKIIARNFNAPLLSVVPPARPDRKSLPETSTRPCFRLSLRRARTDNHYPKLQRALASVHGFVAATRHTLPSFSPRLAFGCPSGAAGQKIIARNFTAAGQNLIGRNFTASNLCLPLFSSMTYNQIIRKVH